MKPFDSIEPMRASTSEAALFALIGSLYPALNLWPLSARAVHTAPRHTSQVKAEMASKAPHTRRAALQSEAELLKFFMTAFAFAGRRFWNIFLVRVLETRKIIRFFA